MKVSPWIEACNFISNNHSAFAVVILDLRPGVWRQIDIKCSGKVAKFPKIGNKQNLICHQMYIEQMMN